MLRSLKDVQIAVEAALFAHGASAGHAAATGRSLVAAAAERLWALSEELVGQSFDF